MKLFSVVLAICLLGFAAAEIETEENVLVLTDDNFDTAVTENKFILVEFYAPWCTYCIRMDKDYKKAADVIKTEIPNCKLAKLDGDAHKKINRRMNIQGYPTIIFWKSFGKHSIHYHGGRTAGDIVNWLKKKTGPPTNPIGSEEDFTKLKDGNEVAVVGYFADAESAEAKTFVSVADSFDDVPFGLISDAKVAEFVGLADGKVAVFKQGNKSGTYSSDDELQRNIRGERHPLLQEINSQTAPKIFGGDIQNHALLFVSKASDDFEKHTQSFKTAAAEFKGQMLFIYIDSAQEENKRVMEFFGLSDKDVPTYRIIKMSENMAKFKPEDDDLSADGVTKFAQGVLGGVIKRHLMTEEIPEDWNSKPVSVLVGKNFKEVAFDSNKKVFVEFYAPWCGHCKSLAPTWDKLGEKFADDESVVIAKMDSTANEVEEFEIQGFPTLKFFPSGSDKVVDYNGDRSLEAMAEFVASNGEKGNEVIDGYEPPTEPFYANDVMDLVHAENSDDGLADFDKYIKEMMDTSMPTFDENEMMKELEEQMKLIMADIDQAKKEKKDEL